MKPSEIALYRTYEGEKHEQRRVILITPEKVRFQIVGVTQRIPFEIPVEQFSKWAIKEAKP